MIATRRQGVRCIVTLAGLFLLGVVLVSCVYMCQPSQLYVAAETGDALTLNDSLGRYGKWQLDRTFTFITGLDCGEPSIQHESPLFAAARAGHVDIVRVLIDAGADVNAKCTEGGTALTIAASRESRSAIVRMLLRAGADPTCSEPRGRDALAWAALSGDFLSVLDIMDSIKRRPDYDGITVKATAAAAYRQDDQAEKIARYLNPPKNEPELIRLAREAEAHVVLAALANGASADVRDSHGWTALLAASGRQNMDDAIIELLSVGADANVASNHGYTPLMAASQIDNGSYVRLLVAGGADVNCRDAHGRSALHIAVRRASAGMVRTLLAAGADCGTRDKWGRRPIDIIRTAMENRLRGENVSKEILEALQERLCDRP